MQFQKYLEAQVFLVLQKYLEYQKHWNYTILSERDTDMQNNIVKLRKRVRQEQVTKRSPKATERP